jgi:uncharacterized protein (TIGR00290 family)
VRDRFQIGALVTMLTEDGARTRSHGLRPEIIERQAQLLGLETVFGRASWADYESEFVRTLRGLRLRGFTHAIFGDLMFEHHRGWAEGVCREAGLEAVLPIWGTPTRDALLEFLALGGEARLVTVRESALDSDWLGQPLTSDLVPEFEQIGVDPCGECGEFHTLVTHFPGFSARLKVRELGRLYHSGCWLLDLSLDVSRPKLGG